METRERQSKPAESEAANPKFTVLLPVHRGPHLLPFAVESVLRQREASFELFIVCDGAPDATAEYARSCERRDPRVRAFVFPKGDRHGEAHRHVALSHARGRLVAQIADDDLWFDDHLLEMERLLKVVDFGNLLAANIRPDQSIVVQPVDIADPETISVLKAPFGMGMGGPTVVGYRLDTYCRLPEGWAPAPPHVPTDRHMWRKFLALPGIRFGTRVAITALQLDTPSRREWSADQRSREMAEWGERLRDPDECDRIRQLALLVVCRQARAFFMLGPMRLRRVSKAVFAEPKYTSTHVRWLWVALRSRFRRP